MLIPTKSMNPDLSVLAVSGFILQKMLHDNKNKYSDVFKSVKKKDKRLIPLFNLALEFLFLVGLIQYDLETDMIEIISEKKDKNQSKSKITKRSFYGSDKKESYSSYINKELVLV